MLGHRAEGNAFGLAEALIGLVGGFFLSIVALSVYDSATGLHGGQTTYGQDIVSLFALWVGFVGAAVVASRVRLPAVPGAEARPRGSGSVVSDFGLRIRPLVDVPLGIVVGVGSQYLLVPLLELPLRPFVPNLSERLGHPAHQLLGPASSGGGAAFAVVAVLVCVGSPVVEELFFRGLVLRALLGRLGHLGPKLAPVAAIVTTGILFGLVHFEALQFLGLAGFGIVLGILAWRSGRLGPSIVAHMAFNATTVIAFAVAH